MGPTHPKLTPEARAYRNARAASERAADARANLPPGSSRAKVTTANARWRSQAEERDRLEAELTADERASVGLAPRAASE